MTPLQVGERVTVYEDPVTENKPEGVATLLKRAGDELGVWERWVVRFDADGPDVERSVRPRNRVTGKG